MKKIVVLTIGVCTMGVSVFAQHPVKTIPSSYDTVYVEEEPVIYNIPLEVEESFSVKYYVNGYIGFFQQYSSYKPCKGCEEFLEQYKSSVTPLTGYMGGVSMMYAPTNWVMEAGISYTTFGDKFNYENYFGNKFSSDNKFNYLDLEFSGGYWFRRNRSLFSVVVTGGLAYNRLLKASGYVNNFHNPNEVVLLSSDEKISNNQVSIVVHGKLLFLPQQRCKVSLEPYYMGSLENITKKYYPYAEVYNKVGIRLGVLYSL